MNIMKETVTFNGNPPPGLANRMGFDTADLRSLGMMAGGAAIIIPLATWLFGGIDAGGFGVLRPVPDPGPILRASPILLLHLMLALIAIVSGIIILSMRKGTLIHRLLGRAWAALMIAMALAGFAIEPTRFTPAHATVFLVFWMIPLAIARARKGDMRGHRRTIAHLLIAMVIVGGLTILPGHLLHPVFFTPAP